MRCTAKAKATGEQCRRGAVTGYPVCQVHGAGSPNKGRPGGGPLLRNGRYSKVLPERLAERYQEAQADGELLALRDEVALLDARIGTLFEVLGDGDSARLWKELKDTYYKLERAVASGNKTQQQELQFDLSRLIRTGGSEYEAWDEICNLWKLRIRLVESERKRLVEMQQMISSERAMALMAVIVDTVRKHVSDRDALAAIAQDIRRLTVIDVQ